MKLNTTISFDTTCTLYGFFCETKTNVRIMVEWLIAYRMFLVD